MKKQILDKLGKSTTGKGKTARPDIEFNEVSLSDGTIASSCYVWKNEVYIIDNECMDVPFDCYSIKDQELIYNEIMKLSYK